MKPEKILNILTLGLLGSSMVQKTSSIETKHLENAKQSLVNIPSILSQGACEASVLKYPVDPYQQGIQGLDTSSAPPKKDLMHDKIDPLLDELELECKLIKGSSPTPANLMSLLEKMMVVVNNREEFAYSHFQTIYHFDREDTVRKAIKRSDPNFDF